MFVPNIQIHIDDWLFQVLALIIDGGRDGQT